MTTSNQSRLWNNDIGLIVAVQKLMLAARSDPNFRHLPTSDTARTALICTLRDHWPDIDKVDGLRHKLLMAFTGRPIVSQNDLGKHETKILLEALNEPNFFPPDGGCQLRIQKAITTEFSGTPWNIVNTWRPES